MRFLSRLLAGMIFLAVAAAIAYSQGYPQPVFNNDIKGWGCSTALADNGPCINAAIAANANGNVFIHGGPYLVQTPIVANVAVNIYGDGGGQGIYTRTCLAGLRQNAANIDVLTTTVGGVIANLCLDQAGGITNTSGHGIYVSNPSPFKQNFTLSNNQVNNSCFGIGVTANGPSASTQNLETVVDGNISLPAANNSCAAYVIGDKATGGATGNLKMTNNSAYCGNNLGIGLLIKDVGGVYFQNNIFSYMCNVGTYINPGVNQNVLDIQTAFTVFGDTDNLHDLWIDTADSSAVLFANTFDGGWASNATTGSNVFIRNTGNTASATGLYFRNFKSYINNGQNGFDVGGSWTNVAIQSSTLCGTNGNQAGAAIIMGGSVSNFQINDNKISTCDTFAPGTLATGISITSSASRLGIVDGNSFGNNTSTVLTPLNWAPGGNVNFVNFVLGNNLGITDTQSSAIASAASISLPASTNLMVLTGTTTITNIVGSYWPNRTVSLFSTTAGTLALNVGAGTGAVCNAKSLTQFQTITATYITSLGCWALQGP